MTTDEQILEMLTGLYIQSLRNYDLLALIANKLGAEVVELSKLHQEGQVLCPDPALIINDEKDTLVT